jgi:hypothetical protein
VHANLHGQTRFVAAPSRPALALVLGTIAWIVMPTVPGRTRIETIASRRQDLRGSTRATRPTGGRLGCRHDPSVETLSGTGSENVATATKSASANANNAMQRPAPIGTRTATVNATATATATTNVDPLTVTVTGNGSAGATRRTTNGTEKIVTAALVEAPLRPCCRRWTAVMFCPGRSQDAVLRLLMKALLNVVGRQRLRRCVTSFHRSLSV